MYKKIVTALTVLILFSGALLFADEAHSRDIDIIVEDILGQSGVSSLSGLSPEDVSPGLLEELGDAVMDRTINDSWHHEMADYMLGGEGSDQLAAYHRDLGAQYILSGGEMDTISSYGGRGWMPRGGMFETYRYRPSRYGWDSGYSPVSRLAWLIPVIIAAVTLLAVLFIVFGMKKRTKRPDQALMILKRRFARGEISKDEFDRMRDVLSS
jgi:uncharacterized membrane protein